MKALLHRFIISISGLVALAVALWSIQSVRAGAFVNTGSMSIGRGYQTATLLPNGQVLVAGGAYVPPVGNGLVVPGLMEVYDPSTGLWSPAGSLVVPRYFHTATLLPNGKVLIVGGEDTNGIISSAELYDPSTRTSAATGSLVLPRYDHTATLLTNGQVLVAGGVTHSGLAYSSELYDPSTGMWTTNANSVLAHGRYSHSATLLTNGQVLVAGGLADGSTNITELTTSELYDPVSGNWSPTGDLNFARFSHTATMLPNGQVLIVGDTVMNSYTNAELYDPGTGIWTLSNSNHYPFPIIETSSAMLPNGQILFTGFGGTGYYYVGAELYITSNGVWTSISNLNSAQFGAATTLLANGQVLITGGPSYTPDISASAELYDPAISPATGVWSDTASLPQARYDATATVLPDGKVMLVGGIASGLPAFQLLSNSVVYDPVAATWTTNGMLNTARYHHTATLLPNGKVLIAGGASGALSTSPPASAELFDPAGNVWALAGLMSTGRVNCTATLLPNGKVLVAGGSKDGMAFNVFSSAEIYDPTTGTWSATGLMTTPRYSHTATLLPNGKVLVAGGAFVFSEPTPGTELYDPVTGTWAATGDMITGRGEFTATLLPNGKVLVAGGVPVAMGPAGGMTNAELYDPAAGTWAATGGLNTGRYLHRATLLANGKVLVTGGQVGANPAPVSTTSSELYDPATGTWTTTGALTDERQEHTASLLPDGRVLVAGGVHGNVIPVTSAEIYDPGQGSDPSRQPQIATATSPLKLGGSVALTGSGFRGSYGGGGGGSYGAGGGPQNDSPADFPVVQLRSLESGQVKFLLATNWSANSFASTPVLGFPPGFALATVFVDGIPGTSQVVNVSVPVPAMTTLTGIQTSTNGSLQFAFTNTVGALLGALATTNITLPLSNWTRLSGVIEIAPGQFQFSDPQATNNPGRFYGVFAP